MPRSDEISGFALLTAGFLEWSARISLYSLPTKLPEYLASGKSVLFHAPGESAIFRVAERYDLTPRLDTIEPEALDAFVDTWAEADQNVCEATQKAKRALVEEFDIDRLSKTFQSAFV